MDHQTRGMYVIPTNKTTWSTSGKAWKTTTDYA